MLYGAGKYTYELLEGWAKCPAEWSFIDVSGISLDAQGRLFVFNRSEHPVALFDREGNFLQWWGEGLFQRPHGSFVAPDGSIYCTDDGNHTVRKFTPDGKILLTLGKENEPSDSGYQRKDNLQESLATIKRGAPPFNRPTGVAVSPSGVIFVSDGYGNARVHKFTADGKLLLSWGEPGTAPGQFRLPHSVCIDRRGWVWVADRENSRLQIFTPDGKFVDEWTDLSRPTDIFIDANDIVYVSELTRRVSIFTMKGKLLARWGNGGPIKADDLFIAPHAIAVDMRGDLYVGDVAMTIGKMDRGCRTLQKFVRK